MRILKASQQRSSPSSGIESLLDHILKRHPHAQRQSRGLERFKTLLSQLGNPQAHLPPTIHVAGTNGKGSVIAFMRSILEAEGYRVSSYASPHLMTVNERIYLPRSTISEDDLFALLTQIIKATNGEPHTYFEILTAASFLAFKETPADYCLIETGLGGRLDPTNVIESQIATVITRIDFDHMNILGNTLEKIAVEKAGIFRPYAPAFTLSQPKTILTLLKAQNPHSLSVAPSLNPSYSLGLRGEFQKENAALASYALRQLPQIHLSPQTVIEGLKNACWPGRLQKIPTNTNKAEFWMDGAHNHGAAKAIAQYFEDRGTKKLNLIFGMAKNKDPRQFLAAFAGMIEKVYCPPLHNLLETWKPEELQKHAQDLGYTALVCPDLKHTLNQLLKESPKAQTFLICGSLKLVGQALATMDFTFPFKS